MAKFAELGLATAIPSAEAQKYFLAEKDWQILMLFLLDALNTSSSTTASGASKAGAPNWLVTIGAGSTSSAVAIAARATRRSLAFTNEHASIVQYIRQAGAVTTANGKPVQPGQSVGLNTTGAVYVIAASGTPEFSIVEEYD